MNPLAYWTFEDTFDYIAKYKVPHHPLHAKGYPSMGDAKDTIAIPGVGPVENYKVVDGILTPISGEPLDVVKFENFEFVGDKTKVSEGSTLHASARSLRHHACRRLACSRHATPRHATPHHATPQRHKTKRVPSG